MDDRERAKRLIDDLAAKRLIDDLPEDELAIVINVLELMRNVAGFSAEMEEFLEDFDSDFDSDHDFDLDADDDEFEEKHRHFSFRLLSERQGRDGEPRLRRWEWGF